MNILKSESHRRKRCKWGIEFAAENAWAAEATCNTLQYLR
jgi:hypothetical protein